MSVLTPRQLDQTRKAWNKVLTKDALTITRVTSGGYTTLGPGEGTTSTHTEDARMYTLKPDQAREYVDEGTLKQSIVWALPVPWDADVEHNDSAVIAGRSMTVTAVVPQVAGTDVYGIEVIALERRA